MADKSAATYHPYNTPEEAREAEFVRQYLGVQLPTNATNRQGKPDDR